MNFIIKKTLFEKYLNIVDRAIDDNSTYMQLRNVYINVNDTEIEIVGADNDISIKALIPISNDLEIFEGGTALVSSSLLKKIISKLQNNITFIKKENKLIIQSNDTNYDLILQKNQQYPIQDFSLTGQSLEIGFPDLKKAINGVAFATSERENDLRSSSISIEAIDSKLIFIATDSYRLAKEVVSINKNPTFQKTVNAKNIKKLITIDEKDVVELYVDTNSISMVIDNVIMKIKLVDIMYKNYDSVFPNNIITSIAINKKTLNDLISKIALVTDDNHNRFTLSIKKDEIIAKSSVKEVAIMQSSTKDFQLHGSELEIDFNHNFFKEAISVYDGEINILIDKNLSRTMFVSKTNPGNSQIISALRRA